MDLSSSSSFDRTQPYNRLPMLPPPAAIDLESKKILRAVADTAAWIARVDGRAEATESLELLSVWLPAMEAQASSAMENVVTTIDQLMDAFADAGAVATSMSKEASRYLVALLASQKDLPVSYRLAREICAQILGPNRQVDLRTSFGTALRKQGTLEIIYTPPVGRTILLDLLDNWATFVNDSASLHPLVRLAVAHYQFEAIHPFEDGNGRTGRILNMAILRSEGLLKNPVIFPSRNIFRFKDVYDARIQRLTESQNQSQEAWEEWILFILRVLRDSAVYSLAKIERFEACARHIESLAHQKQLRFWSPTLKQEICRQPRCRVEQLVRAKIGTYKTCRKYLEQLVEAGILIEEMVGMEKTYFNKMLWRTLEAEERSQSEEWP